MNDHWGDGRHLLSLRFPVPFANLTQIGSNDHATSPQVEVLLATDADSFELSVLLRDSNLQMDQSSHRRRGAVGVSRFEQDGS